MRSMPQACLMLLVSGILFLAAVAGCSTGPATGDVRGKVTFKGKPVTEGSVEFLNVKEGGNFGADIGTDGSYVIEDVLVGDYVVTVTPPMVMMDTDPGKSPPAPVEKPAPNIPVMYRQQGSTPLRTPIKQGQNDFNIEMK